MSKTDKSKKTTPKKVVGAKKPLSGKALLKKWVKVLRSGKIKQGTGSLCRETSDLEGKNKTRTYCVLGVLCLVSNPKGFRHSKSATMTLHFGKTKAEAYLPPALAKRTGIGRDEQEKLVNLNDSEGYSFEELADYIGENLL